MNTVFKPQRGSVPILLAVIAAVLVVVSVFLASQRLSSKPVITKQDYRPTLSKFNALKKKTFEAEAKGVLVSAVKGNLPVILSFIAKDNLTAAQEQIASSSALIDSLLAQKMEADTVASEAARKSAQQAAKKKAEEEAKKKAEAEAATKAAQAPAAPAAAPQPVAAAPNSGYARISVTTERGTFSVDVVTADLGSGARIITDTGANGTCVRDCPVLSLADYVSRNGGYAGVNGPYFCPTDYSGCADMKNSTNYFVFGYLFKTFMNTDKRDYNNAGSAFVFRPGSVQFYRDPQGAPLDTGVTGEIASYPTLVVGKQVVVNEGVLDDKSRTVKGNRGGLGHRGNVVYLMVAHGATVGDLAYIMKGMDIDNGINLDGGGSSALYFNGYKVGPGRALPAAIVIAR